jgi:tetratricopeptide (TPR) repeat protein
MKPQRVQGTAFVRRALFRPSDASHDVILGFVEALTRVSSEDGVGLAELLAPGQTAADLAGHLRSAPDAPGFVLSGTLDRLAEISRKSGRLLAHEQAKLILIVDQFEELFTRENISVEDQKLFVRLLGGMARSGVVWVVVTMRSDLWWHSTGVPELITLSEGLGRLDISPPTPAELSEIIRKPVQAAGLTFEIHPETGLSLDEVIAEHASAQPGALPLLSFTLDELYAKDVTKGASRVLTYATYDALGHIDGAIATRAEETVAALAATTQAALPRLLRALTTISTGGTHHVPVARASPLAEFPAGSAIWALVEVFTEARLLVAYTEGAVPTVRLAHEALIGHWKSAKEQLALDQRDLETRALVERHLTRWSAATGTQKWKLLLVDPDLANAIDLEKRWGDELDVRTHTYIQASRRRARLRHHLTAAAAVVFAIVAFTAIGEAILTQAARRQAERQTERAEHYYADAKKTVDELISLIARGLSSLRVPTETITRTIGALKAMLEGLARENPNDASLDESQYAMLTEFAATYQIAGNRPLALQSAEQGLAIARRQVLRSPDSLHWRQKLLSSLEQIGDLKRLGDVEGARNAYQQRLEIVRRLVAQEPDNVAWNEDMAFNLEKIGDLTMRLGDVDGARKVFSEELNIRRLIFAKESTNSDRQIELVNSLWHVGSLMRWNGQMSFALSAFREALELIEKLDHISSLSSDQRDLVKIIKEKIAETTSHETADP